MHVQVTLTDITVNLLQPEPRSNLMCRWSRLKSATESLKTYFAEGILLGSESNLKENSQPIPQPGGRGEHRILSPALAASFFSFLPADFLSHSSQSEQLDSKTQGIDLQSPPCMRPKRVNHLCVRIKLWAKFLMAPRSVVLRNSLFIV